MKHLIVLVFTFCFFTYTQGQVTANFTNDNLDSCGQRVVHFTNLSTNATSYFWDFGDGNNSTSTSPTVTENYVNPGTYTVTLIAVNGNLRDTISKIIHVWKKPQAGFEGIAPLQGCVPLNVQLNDTSIHEDGNIVSWNWDFGDGFGSTTQNPLHVFNTIGTWNIFLQVTDIHNCSNSAIYNSYVKVSNPPQINISANATHNCTVPFTVNFTNSTIGQNPLTYSWAFGDDSTSTLANPSHTYTIAGTYSITVTATDPNGCSSDSVYTNYISITPVVALFHFTPDTACPGETVSFFNDAGTTCIWGFGDGSNTSTLVNPTHIYNTSGTYQIMFVASPGTCQDIAYDTITIRTRPIAAFAASTHYVCSSSMAVTFTDTSANSASWNWSINGGIPYNSTTQNPSATYSNEGNYQTTLIITDNYGCTSLPYTDPTPIVVDFPTAAFSWDGLPNHCIPYDVAFTDGSSCNAIDNITGWNWDFGDGGNSTLQNPNYTYTTPGEYTITLTVTTDSGCTSPPFTQTIKVGSHQTPGISYTYTGGCANDDTIHFYSASTDVNLIDYWDWTFISHFETDSAFNVATSSDQDPIVDFHGNDSITIQYIIGYLECKDTLIDTNAFLLNGPFLDTLKATFNCVNPLHVGLSFAHIKQANRWYWDYNADGIYDDSTIFAMPVYAYHDTIWHDFPSRGNYTVHLIAYNDITGCYYEDSLSFRIYVIDAVITAHSPNCYNNNYINISNSLDWENANYTINYGDGQIIPYTVFYDSISHNFPPTNGVYNVILSMQNLNGCIDADTTTIRIYYPVAGFTMNQDSGCAPLVINFTDTSHSEIPYTLTWYSNGNGSTTFNLPSYTYNNTGISHPYLHLVDSIGCVSNFTGPAVTVLNLPPNFSALDSTICLGDTVYFNSSIQFSNSYKWDFGDNSNFNGLNPSHLYADTGSFAVSLINQSSLPGCGDTIIKPSFIHVQSILANISLTDSISTCYPFGLDITNNTNTMYSPNWNWTFGDGAVGNQFEPIHNYTLPGNYWLILEATTTPENLFGCKSKDSIPIIVGGPYAEISYTDTNICKGESITFSLVDTIGVTSYTWSFGDGGSGTTSPFTYQFNYLPPSGLAKVYLIYQSNSNCVKKDSAYINIYQVMSNFNYLNSVTGNNDSVICQPGSLNFYNYSLGADSMYWNLGNGNNFSSTDSLIVPPTQTYPNTTNNNIIYNITLTVFNTSIGCIDSISKQYTVYPMPQLNIGNDVTICHGSSVQLNANGGNVISWSPSQGLSNTGVYSPIANPDSSIWYHATIYDTHNCVNSDSIFVFVQQIPSLTHIPDTTIIIGEIVDVLANSDQSTVSYNWTPSYGLSCTTCPNPIAQPLTTTTYTIEIVDSLNCFHIQSQLTIEVKEEYSIDVPTAFTPNGDGDNDIVYVRGWGIKNLLEFKIYNRWGECIFTTDDINQGWDGTFKGIKQNIETYAYTAKIQTYSGKVLTKNGLINLLK